MSEPIVKRLPPLMPEVDQAREFLEISRDFTRPQEIVREAVSNAYDAGATRITIDVYMDKSSGVDELVVAVTDNGKGMDMDGLKAFFDLGRSTHDAVDSRGQRVGDFIGYKGHGTKIYYNSSRVSVETWRGGTLLNAAMTEPKRHLNRRELPEVQVTMTQPGPPGSGTTVRVEGYNNNEPRGFSHRELKDYIYWFTKWASFEGLVGRTHNQERIILLNGLGNPGGEHETLHFGHAFPPEATSVVELRKKHNADPMRFFVKHWVFRGLPLQGHPEISLDMIVSLEGDSAKLQANEMLRRRGREPREGDYTVMDRYGLWLCRDFIPVERFNHWISDKGYEWTRYHALVNCQALELTANRGDVENTPKPVLEALRATVEAIFESRITASDDYKRFEEALEAEQLYKSARQETEDWERRRRLALEKKVAVFDGRELVEPRQEAGVFGLFVAVKTMKPDLFDFDIVDYDTQRGYDALVRARDGLDPKQTHMRFVEFKKELTGEFSHSFSRLSAVVCWDCRLHNEAEVRDLEGQLRTLIITPKPEGGTHKRYVLRTDEPSHNIEVFVLKDYLKERLGVDMRPRTG